MNGSNIHRYMKSTTYLAALAVATMVATPLVFVPNQAPAQTSQSDTRVGGVAEREIARRQAIATRAQEALLVARKAMAEGDYETATSQYKGAYDLLPDSVASSELRATALKGFSEASVKWAEQRIAEGRYVDAEAILERVLEDEYNPDYRPAIQLLARMEQGYFNTTITPEFIGQVDEVNRLFQEAQNLYDTGRFDAAFRRYDMVLSIDPYNIAARRGQERVHRARQRYANQAYSETRARALWEVTQAWENPVRYGREPTIVTITDPTDRGRTQQIQQKLDTIIIPSVNFQNVSIREAIDFLRQRSRELDPTGEGVNIVLKLEPTLGGAPAPAAPVLPSPGMGIPGLDDEEPAMPAAPAPAAPAIDPSDVRITLNLQNVPLAEVLRYITQLAGLKINVEAFAVAIVPLSEPTDILVTRQYQVPPNFISAVREDTDRPAVGRDRGPATGREISPRAGARQFLEGQGVPFPPGASAQYLPATSRLIVRNTQENLELIDALVEAFRDEAPRQIEIESKFVEVTQTDLRELGFDLLLGPFSITDGGVMGAGGTFGNTPVPSNSDFPFVEGGNIVGQDPVTAGLRTGSSAISANAIDALLFGFTPGGALAPGIFSMAGIMTDPQFQFVIRALDQKKGVDLLSAPKVTTRSGQRAVIEIIREFRYPVEFDPPQIPQQFGGGSGFGDTINVFPVTPTTPTVFETRNTGVTLEVEPTVGPDGVTIDLNLIPQVVEFEGFINYGSPIRAGNAVVTENVINQPIFSTRKVTTSVSIWDGQTVVLGGLIREDVQKVEDKVPFLGDIPFIGRAFRSSVDNHVKRNLMMFVTARLIDPAGNPIAGGDVDDDLMMQQEPSPFPDDTLGLPELPALPSGAGAGGWGRK